ncbi:DEAD/DEAH box helicase [Maribacter dokdonensis]|uniref:DEAD/DEAH box helicase n=1 Tax=Maribacter dokdonensis TaxID=320912 RepID=UPI0027376C97|nr:DEAD/DEAH box helicase [Maribacter dokdonensis]MDP2526485.1 hypothetical protein [Maribacter dokdonensis]
MRTTRTIPFENPIEYKELNQSDFDGYIFDEAKIVVEPDENGYISDRLREVVNLTKGDATVINAGVGQGKTKAIIDQIKWYVEAGENGQNKYKVVVVTPFLALNKEYNQKICKAVGNDEVCFDYQVLSYKEDYKLDFPEFCKMPVQLISIMSILGDPGQVAFKQSEVKRQYYEYLIQHCANHKERVIFIFDEIHESLGTFKPDLIPNLLEWKRVAYKAIIASATFTESSKFAIKLISELTNRKLRIVESKRKQNSNNLSELHLCFYNQFTLNPEHQFMKDLVQQQLDYASTVNILCYSKKVAKELYEGSVGDMLRAKYGTVTLCISGEENSFNHDGCNIGTRFKTGVSIEKENSAYFVILPTRFAYTDLNSQSFGIFNDRINSLIQGLARPRKKSKIFVITPSPTKLISRSTDNSHYRERLSLNYLGFQDEENRSQYYSFRQQEMFLKRHYDQLRNSMELEITQMENLTEDIRALYSSFDWFRLKDGDRYLYSQYDAYGKNLSNYLYWAAWNNQFVNCKLESIIRIGSLKFTEGNIQQELDMYYPHEVFNENTFCDYHDKYLYTQFRNTLFSTHLFYKRKGEPDYRKIEPKRNQVFEQQILHFIQRRKTPYLFEPKYGCPYSTKLCEKPVDGSISKATYFRVAMGHALSYIDVDYVLTESEEVLVSTYDNLLEYQGIILNSYSILEDDGTYFLPLDSKIILEKRDSINLKAIFSKVKEHDVGMVAFSDSNLSQDKGIYSLLKEMFYETTKTTKSIEGEVVKCWKVSAIREITGSEFPVNLVYSVSDPFLHMPRNPNDFIEGDDEVLEGVNLIDMDSSIPIFDYYNDSDGKVKRDKMF